MSIIGDAALRFRTLGLGDAAGQCDQGPRSILAAKAADIRIGFLGRFLADVAGVEDDEVGILAFRRRGHAVRAQQLGHALAVIDVHLAAEGFDLESSLGRRSSGFRL